MPSQDLIVAGAAFVAGVVLTLATAWLQRRTALESERSRFRHEMGTLAAKLRFDKHVELMDRVGNCYRLKVNMDSGATRAWDDLKNFYYANRVFFGDDLQRTFGRVRADMERQPFNRTRLEERCNDLRAAVADDLLLKELSQSARRAVRGERWWLPPVVKPLAASAGALKQLTNWVRSVLAAAVHRIKRFTQPARRHLGTHKS
jgi:hypothetical protein